MIRRERMAKLFVEKFVQHENRFGIKVADPPIWINGLGKCPQDIIQNGENEIPYYKVVKNGRTYYNYGTPEKSKTGQGINELRKDIEDIKKGIEEILALVG